MSQNKYAYCGKSHKQKQKDAHTQLSKKMFYTHFGLLFPLPWLDHLVNVAPSLSHVLSSSSRWLNISHGDSTIKLVWLDISYVLSSSQEHLIIKLLWLDIMSWSMFKLDCWAIYSFSPPKWVKKSLFLRRYIHPFPLIKEMMAKPKLIAWYDLSRLIEEISISNNQYGFQQCFEYYSSDST